MRSIFASALFLVIALCGNAAAQSGRAAGSSGNEAGLKNDRSAKELFVEVNEFRDKKFAEYELKKIPYSEALRIKTENERKQLSAKYAAIVTERKPTLPDELYYGGMLHWLAENLDGTAEMLTKYLASEPGTDDRRQNARAILVFTNAKQKNVANAIAFLEQYEKIGPTKIRETWRMNVEIAKALLAAKEFEKASAYANKGYANAKELLRDSTVAVNPLDAALDAAMLAFDAYRNSGKIDESDAVLIDLRKTALSTGNALFFFYAADKLITHQIETGRKPLAMETYLSALVEAGKGIALKDGKNEAIVRLKTREKHYKMLGEPAPEIFGVDKWFPGTPTTFANLKGKVILLDFWATWCGPCFDAFPHFTEWQQDFSDKGLVILGVTRYYGHAERKTVDEPTEILFLKRFREKYKLPYDFVVTKDQQFLLAYGATALPTTVLIDRKGQVRYFETGSSPSRLAEMRVMMLKLLDEK
jgi:thiol-disulfide isomerase/thioredoxin